MTLCVCGGIIELGWLLVAALLPVLPFLRKLYIRRNTVKESKDCCDRRKRIPYVTGADLIKMRRKDKE